MVGYVMASNGAAKDIERATGAARNMVLHWGFSSRLGAQLLENDETESYYYGGGSSQLQGMSEASREIIDAEIRDILTRNYDRARKILEDNMDILHAMKDALMKYETIDAEQIEDLMARRPMRDIASGNQDGSSGSDDGKSGDVGKEKPEVQKNASLRDAGTETPDSVSRGSAD